MGASAEAFRPGDRLKRRADYQRVQSQGRKVHTPHFVFALLPRALADAKKGDEHRVPQAPPGSGVHTAPGEAVGVLPVRLGVTVTKKIASAVGRNRIKRVMREVFRRNRQLFPAACDVVAIAKQGAGELGYAEVLAEISRVERAMAREASSARRRA